MKEKTFGFILGNEDNFPINIKETTEKKALIKLIEKHWKLIEERGQIILLGEEVDK
jgi:hypothetical protein